MSDSVFKKEKTQESTLEPQEEKRTAERGTVSTGLPDYQLWSICIWKIIRALAATLLGGALVYFVCRLLIR